MLSYIVFLLVIAGIYALLAQSLCLAWGVTGLVNLGLAGFFAIGAYASATVVKWGGAPVPVGLVAAMAAGAMAGFVVCVSTLRLRDDYLAIVTLGFAEAVRVIASNEIWLTGGTDGISGIPAGLPRDWGQGFHLAALVVVTGLLALVWARIPRPKRTVDDGEQGLWHEAATGFAYVRERRGLFGLLVVFGLSNFMFGIASIAITPLILSLADPALLGMQMAIGGVGLLIGGLAMSTWGGPSRRVVGMLGFSMLAGVFLAAHGLRPSFALVVVAGFLFFLSVPIINASNATLWQSKVPADLQGRCFAIQRVLSESAMPVAFCLAGPLAEHVFEPLMAADGPLAGSIGLLIGTGPGRGLGLMFIVLGLAMVAIAAVAWSVRSIRNVEDELPDAPVAAEPVAPAAPVGEEIKCVA